eukprot:TRINITY_DN11043_c0_g1_i1.p1 TRINITY_DN11043_c0_g1~~TRINITY_DN11043_c0_g1_i1.p1  ORF type:complete len:151 (-),score=28.11 TRINITY_DN11043_c0_g1_i1:50-502(-)
MKNFGLENNLYFASLKSLGKQNISVNDKIFVMNDIRGYNSFNIATEQQFGSTCVLKASTKLIIYDFPFLKNNQNLLPFFYGNAYYENLENKITNKNLPKSILSQLRAVFGIGIQFDIAPKAKIELLFNFSHFAQQNDFKKYFQLRFSIDD